MKRNYICGIENKKDWIPLGYPTTGLVLNSPPPPRMEMIHMFKELEITSRIKDVLKKKKSYPCIRPWSPYGWDTSRIPHFLDNRLTNGGEVVNLKRRPRFTPPPPQEYSCYSFLLGGWVNPRTILRLERNKKIQWTRRDSNQRPSGL
jgi:hypothetical protein